MLLYEPNFSKSFGFNHVKKHCKQKSWSSIFRENDLREKSAPSLARGMPEVVEKFFGKVSNCFEATAFSHIFIAAKHFLLENWNTSVKVWKNFGRNLFGCLSTFFSVFCKKIWKLCQKIQFPVRGREREEERERGLERSWKFTTQDATLQG